jgi:hypothetical protein
MKHLGHSMAIICAALLAACGAGGDAGSGSQQAAAVTSKPGIAVGEPAPNGVDREAFIQLANQAECGDLRNRLFLIDGKQVFSDIQGNCADAGTVRTLYGSSPSDQQCNSKDSIAGPVTSCISTATRPLFDTILKNLDKPDLGLGKEHTVEKIDFLSKAIRNNFIQLARGAACSDIRNRLFLIDGKEVFWETQGNCADMGFARTLFEGSPAEVLCTNNDSLAGGVSSCTDKAMRPLFDVIVQNLDKKDLGLGNAHKVEEISVR